MTRELAEWIAAHDNQPIPRRVKMRVLDRSEGVCGICTVPFGDGKKIEFDHSTALVNGGEHRERNLRAVHAACHRLKTKEDVAEKARNYRKRAKAVGIKKPRTITRWRKMNGDIVIAGRER